MKCSHNNCIREAVFFDKLNNGWCEECIRWQVDPNVKSSCNLCLENEKIDKVFLIKVLTELQIFQNLYNTKIGYGNHIKADVILNELIESIKIKLNKKGK